MATLSLPVAHSPIEPAAAASCTITSGSVTLGSGSCDIEPGSSLIAQTAINGKGGQITANGIRMTFTTGGGLGAVAQKAAVIIFGRRLNRRRGALLATMALVAVTAFAPSAARAQDATWLPNPTSGDFNTAANWNPASIPSFSTAFFGTSNTTALTFRFDTTVNGWTFNAGASAYTFANNQSLSFNGAGIVINGGSASIRNTHNLDFNFTSTAGNATINNVDFGSVDFTGSSAAGNATINNNSNVFFFNTTTAGNATINNAHNLFISDNSTGGNAAITNTRRDAVVDFSDSRGLAGDNKLTVGSIAGGGSFQLGRNELTVGDNNMSTDVSGSISGILGSLVKVGSGTLTLSGNANLRGTTVDGGRLAVNGGTFNASNTIVVGSTAGSSGTLNIAAGGGATTQNLIVAQSGVGVLAVQDGGTLTDFGGFVGNLPGSRGTATVSGAGSTWTSTGTIQVGSLGRGTVTIENGGTVNSGGGGSIGLSTGSTGTVTVTGPGSTWSNSPGGGLNIGSFGTGTLSIANGGMVINNTAFTANIGEGANSQGTVTVTGKGSTWSNGSGVNIGKLGTGTLTIADGGIVSAGHIGIATNAGAVGTLNIGAGAGDPAAAPGTLTAPSLAFGAGTGTLDFNHNSADYVFAPAISGNGTVNALAGTTILTGANSYGGATSVSAGALFVNGDQSGATGATDVAGGATLGGTGTIGGNVSVANGGTLAPGGVGGGIGTLTVNGSLGLNSGSILNYSFGQAGVVGGPFNDLAVVKDNLTLAGTLNVALTPGGAFDPGLYRVISYGGTLTDNGLALGTVPPGTTAAVQTSVAHQVNLVNTTGLTLENWDGAAAASKNNGVVDGGTGSWQSPAGNNNWTNVAGTLNAPWANAGFATFEAAPGTVTVDNSRGQVVASGLQFAVGGYTLTGAPITLVETAAGSGATVVRVGDGTAAGTGMTATIAAVLQGGTRLAKDDLGTLVLSGANSYSGGTAISAGTLQLGDGGTTGSILGNVADDGTLAFNRTDTVSFPGVISGIGTLAQIGTGTTILTGNNSFTGGTTISAGTLQLGNGSTPGSVVGNITNNLDGTLNFNATSTAANTSITNSGRLNFNDTSMAGNATVNNITGVTNFNNNSTAGGATITNGTNGDLAFNDSSTAGNATINNKFLLNFTGHSTAGNATINNIGVSSSTDVDFLGSSTAGSATINNKARIEISGFSTAGSATIDNSHDILFFDRSTGGNAAITNNSRAATDFSRSTGPAGDNKLTAGSIAGAGSFRLGGNELTVGGDNFSTEVSGVISGIGGSLVKAGTGTMTLSGTNIYSGGTTISAGTLQLGTGGTTGSILGDVADNGTLAFDRSDTVSFPGVISGRGSVSQAGSGTTVLAGTNSYGGATSVSAGALFVNGDQSGATGATDVAGGATLGGTGTVGGNVSVANGGTLAPGGVGGGIGTLTINGSLGLNGGSILNYSFGQAGVVGGPFNDLAVVKDNLTLAGTLNVALTPGGAFDPGLYRVISYGGTLTDNGLALGTVPPGTTAAVQTSVAHQVNLVNTTGLTLENWDGAAAANKNNGVVDGGTGSWQSPAGNNNWTNVAGTLNAPWANAGFATFEAAPGTVTVDNSLGQVVASGLQFAVGGYTLSGAPITLVETAAGSGATVVRVGDGTAAGTGMTATIAAVLQGGTRLVKDDLGTLVLSGANSYSGGTAIDGGAVQVAADRNLGAATGPLSFNGGTLATTASFTSERATTLDSGGGTLDVAPSTTLTMRGAIDGTGALSKGNAGSLVLAADNSYAGGTTIAAGTLQLGDGGTSGSILGDVADNGALAFDRSDRVTFAGVISGTGSVSQGGIGSTILTADNSSTGGTTISAGTLQLGDGGTTGSIRGDVADNGTLAFDRSDTVSFPGVISGRGSVSQAGSGTTVLAGTNSYGGATSVSAGALFVNGDQSGATGATDVAGGATLGGTGTIGGNVSVANGGTLAPGGVGGGIGTLTVNGSLGLNSGSTLNYSFGQAGVVGGPLNDLAVVKDNLTLAGTLNVALTPGGAFDPGLYRVISYGGTLTDNGLALGTVPPGTTAAVQTSVAHQVNLVNTTGVTLENWDGAAAASKNNGVVDGGTGSWQSPAGNNNWTNVAGTLNAPWANAGFATFEAAPGTVTVDNSLGQVVASGLQFAVGGYTLSGAPITLVETAAGSGATVVRVGDGTAAGTGMTATIAAVLQGGTRLVKDDLGTLVLSGANSYSGGTAIDGGAVQVAADRNLGAATGPLSFNGGTLATTASFTSERATTLDSGGGTLDVAPSTTLTMRGAIDGTGALSKSNAGSLVLTGDNSYTGGTTIAAGSLQLGNGGTTGSILGDVADNGALAFDRSDRVTFAGVISGTGSVSQAGTGRTILTGANSYSGGTTIAAGTLQLGTGGTTGSIRGDVADNGTLAFDRSDTVSFPGVISGSGGLAQLGPGTTVLTADNSYTGGTKISAGTLQLGDGGTTGSILGDVADNGTLAFNRSDTVSFPGMISSRGGLAQLGPGSTILTADNTYAGGTTIAAGTLQLGDGGTTGSILGDVADNGALAFDRSDRVTFAGVISGTGSVSQGGIGSTILTADNSSTGGTTISAGTLQLGTGGTTGSILGDVADNGTLAFDRSDTVSFPGVISGRGSVSQAGSGTTVLAGTNSYGGATSVSAGALFVNGDQSGATGATDVAGGATLGGTGTVGGNVSVANGGTLAPGGVGGGIGTLTINGSLGLNGGSILNYSFGQAGVVGGPLNDLAVVKDNLTLAGTLNVALTPGGAFDPGLYRVISYGGTLTDNGLALGTVPPGTTAAVQTSVAHQVNLVNTTGVTLENWDGAAAASKNNGVVDGGTGSWQSPAGNNNWTNVAGTLNAPWANAGFATFEAAPGTVTVDNSLGQVVASGLQFAVGGYTLSGAPITLVETAAGSGATVVRVGDGTAAGTGMTATIAAVLQGGTRLVKDDLGTLVLSGANSYSGGTAIDGGAVQVAADRNLGAATGPLSFNGGTLATTASFTSERATTLDSGGGTLDVAPSTTLTMRGAIDGTGALSKGNAGSLVLAADNSYAGGTTIAAGTLQLGDGGTTGSILGDVADNGALAFDRSDRVTFAGVISGTGSVSQGGIGSTILTADNSSTGGTTISAGTLQLGDGGTTGSIRGDVADNGTLAFDRSDTVSFPGVISGRGSVSQAGSGTTVLAGTNSYGGATSVSAGALFVNGDQSGATGATDVAGGATLGGTGTIGGNVSVANGGTLAPGGVGGGIGTLTVNGSLGLNSGSTLNYSFGQAGVVGGPLNDLAVVKDNLTLAGTLNVALTPGGAFDPGLYRVISYGGTLTDNGLALGTVPPGTTAAVQTSVAHQVNLVNTTGVTLENWDGAAAASKNNGVVDGGTGSWQSPAGNNNWTNVAGTLNAPWANAGFATFEAAPGTVTVDNSLGQVVASGLQFAVGGYTLSGAPITLVETAAGSGATVVRVGDGTAAGTGMTATIAAVLQGGTRLVKDDLGTLVLSGANSYSGGTAIDGGAVQVAADRNLGAATGPLSFNGGTLATTASFTSERATTLDSGGGTLDVAPSTTLTMRGAIDGTGALSKGNAGSLVLAADNSYAGGTTIAAGTLQLGDGGTSGSILGDVADNGALAFDRSDRVTFAGVISGTGSVSQVGGGVTVLTGVNSYTGGTNVDAGSLRAGAPNTFSPNSAVTVAGGGTLDLNGLNQTVSSVTNAGLVNLGTGTAPGTVLTATSYTGAGGTIALNTFLGGEGSPSDRLVVNGGSATGNSLLRVTNAGGPGAETVANGIAVVQAINDGTTAPGAFALAGEVEVGPFDYRLFHGGISGSNPGDWFLRSDFVVSPTPTPTPPTPTPPTPTPIPPANPFPPQAPTEPLPPGVYPIIGPRLSAYGVVQPIARELGLTELGTLHQRIGDTLTTAYPEGEGGAHSAWARFVGQEIDNRYQAFADPRASGHQVGFQTGLDLWRGSLIPDHRDVAGVYFAYGNNNVDVSGLVTNPAATAYMLQHTGTLNLNAYSGGAYWTHYGPGGWYLDAVLQGTGYDGSATAQSANFPLTTKLTTSGSGFLASLEGGYPVPLQFGPNFILEPEAQIVWQHVSFDSANDGVGTVALGSTSGTTARFGARAQWTILGGNGAVWQPYARANLWHGWGADAATTFASSNVAVPLVEQATWLEFAGGVTFKLNPSLSFYAQAGYQFAVAPANVSRDGFAGDLGLRITW